MKKLLFPVLIFLLAGCSQNKPAKQQDDNSDTSSVVSTTDTSVSDIHTVTTDTVATTDPIAFIRKNVENINTSKLENKHFEFMCDEKMTVDYFYLNGEIVKISVDFGTVGDVYAKEDYYYKAGKLIFKYEFVEGGPACEGCIKKNEYRSYIKNNKVIKYLKDQKVTTCRTCEFSASSKENKLLKVTTAEEVKAVLCR
ncbi:hypothetical protein EOD41_06765 [Mucilaginibacter limnophilus]|uniref:Lipoprotein n=1 Tax=Mucilaginibacter limnophilus TaxID=1932778 RepID=A0A437MVK3_9SPHI|nr:hypothetical protein [Mucilaginibacter limnophilus]RVU01656.1 hypothetical protein EOD41_06765 [Mucilaginibacter limnophilus]